MKRFKTFKSYTLYTLLVAFLFCGCGDFEKRQTIKQVESMQIVEFDGCEYVFAYRRIAHKGNCKYCIERAKNNCH